MSFLAFLLPLLFITLVSACSYSRDCDDNKFYTQDVCIPDQHICVNIGPLYDYHAATFRRTLSDIKSEVNDFPLTIKEKKRVITAAIRVYKNVNPHIFMHKNYMGIDVVSQWEKLGRELHAITDFDFHMRMVDIFQQMNDRHSQYVPHRPISDIFAWLGFFVREIFEGDSSGKGTKHAKYIVSDIVRGVLPKNTTLALGSEIITYNGVDIVKAIKSLGKNGYGSNEAAQRENGISQLTYRDRTGVNLPLQEIATITYRNQDGTAGTLKLPWMFEEILDYQLFLRLNRRSGPMKKEKFRLQGSAPIWKRTTPRAGRRNRTEIFVSPRFQNVVYAETIKTQSGTIGRLQFYSFQVSQDLLDDFESELLRLFEQMPISGLVIDLRGNNGGAIPLVKVLADLISAKKAPEQQVSVRSNELMSRIFGEFNVAPAAPWLKRLIISHRSALSSAMAVAEEFTGPTGALYDSVENAKRARVYFGPVITVINALTYSSGDLFAALQVDQNMSLLVGTSDVSGAGGATVVTYSQLQQVFSKFVGEPLPGDIEITTAFMRFYRTGPQAGKIVEHFGVFPQIRYYPTRDDALSDDRDMFEFLGQKLHSMK